MRLVDLKGIRDTPTPEPSIPIGMIVLGAVSAFVAIGFNVFLFWAVYKVLQHNGMI